MSGEMLPAARLRCAIDAHTARVAFTSSELGALSSSALRSRLAGVFPLDTPDAAPPPRPSNQTGPSCDILVLQAGVGLTPVGGADTQRLEATATRLAGSLRPDQLLLLHGPVPPGTTRSLVPLLAANLRAQEPPCFLAYLSETSLTDSVRFVGGLDPVSCELAVSFLRHARIPVAAASSLEAAECGGLLGAVTRATHAALAQELRIVCHRMGVNYWEIHQAADLSEFLPTRETLESTAMLSWGTRRFGAVTRVLDVVSQINEAVPAFLCSNIENILNQLGKPLRGSRVWLLGSPHSQTVCASERLRTLLASQLHQKGVVLPEDSAFPWPSIHPRPVPGAEVLAAQDLVVLLAIDPQIDYEYVVASSSLVLDTCNATAGVRANRTKIVSV